MNVIEKARPREKMNLKVSEKVLRFRDRDIIKVEIGGKVQPFYKSSGRNSGAKGTWFPFDGILSIFGAPVWFDKRKYTNNSRLPDDLQPVAHELNRFGTEELRNVSFQLAQMNIPQGVDTEAKDINDWLGYENG